MRMRAWSHQLLSHSHGNVQNADCICYFCYGFTQFTKMLYIDTAKENYRSALLSLFASIVPLLSVLSCFQKQMGHVNMTLLTLPSCVVWIFPTGYCITLVLMMWSWTVCACMHSSLHWRSCNWCGLLRQDHVMQPAYPLLQPNLWLSQVRLFWAHWWCWQLLRLLVHLLLQLTTCWSIPFVYYWCCRIIETMYIMKSYVVAALKSYEDEKRSREQSVRRRCYCSINKNATSCNNQQGMKSWVC